MATTGKTNWKAFQLRRVQQARLVPLVFLMYNDRLTEVDLNPENS